MGHLPLTENIVLRFVGHARYPNSPGTPSAVVPFMAGLRALPGHVFWPDDISLLDTERFDMARLLSSVQVTDSYLLALAYAHGGQLATFDRRLVTAAVRDGEQGLHLIRQGERPGS
jgi:predicted nucleic acid-binding protein